MFLHTAAAAAAAPVTSFSSNGTHFKQPLLLFLLVQVHPGGAQGPALSRRFRGQVKLGPLQVEAQAGADGFDEALFQSLG